MIKEIEELIEAAKEVMPLVQDNDDELTYLACSLAAGNCEIDHSMKVNLQTAITAAEAMLKRAKVFEGELHTEKGCIKLTKKYFSVLSLRPLFGKRVRIIVIPEEENGK